VGLRLGLGCHIRRSRKEFLNYYNIFDKSFNINYTTNNILFFGKTGCGKSTLFARLLSSLNTNEFFVKINEIRFDDIEIEGVRIASRDKTDSTTITPHFKLINQLQIYDMPGFSDCDNEVGVVINVLCKCLLNRIKENKYFVIIKMNVVKESNLSTFFHQYC